MSSRTARAIQRNLVSKSQNQKKKKKKKKVRDRILAEKKFKTVNNVEPIKCLCSSIELLCSSTEKSKWD